MQSGVRYVIAAVVAGVVALACSAAQAQKKYDTGASDTEIRIGQTMPYSGAVSAYGVIGRIMTAYFSMVNEEEGGVNGRKVTLISYDDGFSPPKTVEQTRKLVESDEVLAITGSLGSATNLAVAKYLNTKKVPQILAMAGASKLDDPATFPWTTTFFSSSAVESQIYAQYILKEKPDGKIGILYQNDDNGKSFVTGMKTGLGSKASMIVQEVSYNVTDPTVDSQVIALKASGADVLLVAA
jgi:ABC-type branched-subunit amino acid transport system substrate-binding protein